MNGIEKQAAFYRGYLTDEKSLVPLTILLTTSVALWLLVYLVGAVGHVRDKAAEPAAAARFNFDRPAAGSRIQSSARRSRFLASLSDDRKTGNSSCRSLTSNRQETPAPTRFSGIAVTVRREAGEEEVVQVHYDEGIANHIGPEPCVVGREAGGEASAGVRIDQSLSRERTNWDADAVVTAEGKTGARVNASAFPALR